MTLLRHHIEKKKSLEVNKLLTLLLCVKNVLNPLILWFFSVFEASFQILQFLLPSLMALLRAILNTSAVITTRQNSGMTWGHGAH